MSALSRLFLGAKAWQIFVFMLVAFSADPIATIFVVGSRSLQEMDFLHLGLLGLGSAIPAFGILLWQWVVGSYLWSIAKPALRPRTAFFKVAVTFPEIYFLAFPALFRLAGLPWAGCLAALGCFALLCMLYAVHFVSKCLVLAETGKPKIFNQFAGTVLLVLLVPIGIWTVQPRINRLYREH